MVGFIRSERLTPDLQILGCPFFNACQQDFAYYINVGLVSRIDDLATRYPRSLSVDQRELLGVAV
jgi:hypothetical protein